MLLAEFLSQLRRSGRPHYDSADPPADLEEPAPETVRRLRALDEECRLEAPLTPPPLDLAVAHWAAAVLARLCQFLVFRELDAEGMSAALGDLGEPGRPGDHAAAAWSADLTFRHLPALERLAAAAAEADPLLVHIRRYGAAWPLSSAGMQLEAPAGPESILAHPSLRLLYLDRLVAARDLSRLQQPATAEAVRQAFGEYPDLATGSPVGPEGGRR